MLKYTFLAGIYYDRAKKRYTGKILDDVPGELAITFQCQDRQSTTLEEVIGEMRSRLEKAVAGLIEKGIVPVAPPRPTADELQRRVEILQTKPLCVSPITVEAPDRTERINITMPGSVFLKIRSHCRKRKTPVSNFFVNAALALLEEQKEKARNELPRNSR